MELSTIKTIADKLDLATIQSFTRAALDVIQVVLNEAEKRAATATPDKVDYAHADHDWSAPAGGWLTPDEIRTAITEITEAIAAEKWFDGFVAAVKMMAACAAM